MLEHMARDTTQDHLADARVGIGTHYEQVTVKLMGRRQKPCANHVVDRLEHRSIGYEAMCREVLLEVRREGAARRGRYSIIIEAQLVSNG
jgi:hypothetical protein